MITYLNSSQVNPSDYEIIIVGAGLSGSVLAERFASCSERVLVVEKRNHVAGNCYDFVNHMGIRVCQYGAHLFHTNSERVWHYINQHAEWFRWEHKVLGWVDEKLVPIPVNITTVNRLCHQHLHDVNDMHKWLKQHQIIPPHHPMHNSREMALSRVGQDLYDKIFLPYTLKQWQRPPEDLHPSVLARIPIRDNFDERYFSDIYQVLPTHGYTSFVEQLLTSPHIDVVTETDYLQTTWEEARDSSHQSLYYTGPIDQFYQQQRDSPHDFLEYRSLRFETEHFHNTPYYQPNSVVNYPSLHYPFTRIVEYKHFGEQQSPHTTIVKEYPQEEGVQTTASTIVSSICSVKTILNANAFS